MALNLTTIKSDVAAAFEAVMNQADDDRQGAIDKVAERIAQAMVNAIQSAEIVYTTGLTSPSGPVTGTFSGNLK